MQNVKIFRLRRAKMVKHQLKNTLQWFFAGFFGILIRNYSDCQHIDFVKITWMIKILNSANLLLLGLRRSTCDFLMDGFCHREIGWSVDDVFKAALLRSNTDLLAIFLDQSSKGIAVKTEMHFDQGVSCERGAVVVFPGDPGCRAWSEDMSPSANLKGLL